MKRLIIDKSKAKRLVDSKKIIKELGAEDTGIKINTTHNPITLFSIRQFIMRMFKK